VRGGIKHARLRHLGNHIFGAPIYFGNYMATPNIVVDSQKNNLNYIMSGFPS
jgi:hypothetical protein